MKKHKNDLHGAMIFGNDTKDAQRGGQVLIDTAIQAGVKSDQPLGISGRDPQSAYTPVINKMKNDGSNYCVQRVVGAEQRSCCAARPSSRV